MASCQGCKFSCDFHWSTGYPFLWVLWGFTATPDTYPDGECVPLDSGCNPIPCLPTGYVSVLSNTGGTVLTIKWRNTPTGPWTQQDVGFGQGVPIQIGGWQIPCGDAYVLAEVWNGATKLGEVSVGCSKCEKA